MNSFDPTTLIQKKRIKDRLSTKTESPNLQTLLKKPIETISELKPTFELITEQKLKVVQHESKNESKNECKNEWWMTELEELFHHLVLEQLSRPEELLKLNKTRRESIAWFLAEVSQLPEPTDPQETLKSFVRIDRTSTEHEGIKQLFKQIGFVLIGKALLLKSWSKNAGNPLLKSDLKDLTGSIEKVIRPYIHLQTSTFQLIQQNFFSWYKMSPESQERLWDILSRMEDSTADAEPVRDWLLTLAIRISAETLGERHRYQEGFYRHLWKHIQGSSILDQRFANHMKNGTQAFAFCPTLRDGSVMKYAPQSLQWIAFEPLTFELIFSEIRTLWRKPQNPFLWVKGSGLEMCMEQQSNLLVTNDGKQNVLLQIDGIASCELAFIAEESLIRAQGRTLAAQALKKQVDQHPILKKLKHPSSTRGMYQACQAFDKLRQNGVLVWAREELLSEASGKPVLQHILNAAKLLMIADFTALQCDDEAIKCDLPKALYIFKKENQMETRKNHRPHLIKAYGSIKNENDMAMLYERVFTSLQKPESVFPAEPFSLHSRVSPVMQNEWEQHWLNPSDDHLIERIEDLKRNASPLGQLAVIRTIPHPSLKDNNELGSLFEGLSNQKSAGFYAWVENTKNGCELLTSSSAHPPLHLKAGNQLFWIAPTQSHWNPSLQMLLRSRLIRDWLNYSIERKKGNWVLKENDLKAVPVPKHLNSFLLTAKNTIRFNTADELLLQQIAIDPGLVHQKLENSFDLNPILKSASFERAAEVLLNHESNNSTLFSLVLAEEQIDWMKLIDSFLPASETLPLDHHPLIRFSASLPTHLSVQTASIVKHPSPGIILANSKGLTQQLYIQHSWLRDLAHERIQGCLKSCAEPTFAELCQSVKLPKNPDQCMSIGQQFLKTFSQEKMRRKELSHLMDACLLSENLLQPQPGLLQ